MAPFCTLSWHRGFMLDLLPQPRPTISYCGIIIDKILPQNIGPRGVRALPLAAGINVVAIVLGILQYNPDEPKYNPDEPKYNPDEP